MNRPAVLISGAGIAGSALAYWLGVSGLDVTVVERSEGIRSSGNPVDVRGAAMEVIERMGIRSVLEEAATHVRTAVIVGPSGRIGARLPMAVLQGSGSDDELEVPRANLSAILLNAAMPYARFVFDDWITALDEDETGVQVSFEHGAARHFDLVVGADGQHSGVRRLVFGPDSDFVQPVGMYVATLAMEPTSDLARDFVLFSAPGRSVSIHPSTGKPLVAFIFWDRTGTPVDLGLARENALERNKRMIVEAHEGLGWRVPELLEQVKRAPDIYFDAVNQIRMSSWSRGRVVLLGDAASSVTLFGEGSSLAIVGASTLAEELAKSPGDLRAAFAEYERKHRLLVDPRQAGVKGGARFLVPKTRLGIYARNLVLRLLPLAAQLRRGRSKSARRS